MRKESQHYQFLQNPHPIFYQQCQEATKKYRRPHQIKSKNDFLDWLKSLPFQIRYLAVKVEAPRLAETIRQTLKRFEFKNDSSEAKKATYKPQKNVLDSLVFTSDGKEFFDSICFDFSYIEYPEKLYDLLMYSGDNVKKFNPIDDMEKNRRSISQSCQEIKHSKSKEQLCKILLRILRHQVFFNTCYKQDIHINDQKNRKKQLSFFWKNLSEQAKHELLYLKKTDLKGLSNFLREKNISILPQQLQKQIAHLLKLQKNQFCNRIFKCKLKKSLSSITDYHHMIYDLWKQQYERYRKKKNKRYFSMMKCQNYKESKFQQPKLIQQTQVNEEKQNSIDSFQTNETQIFQKLQETVIKKHFFKESYLNDFIEKKLYNNLVQFSNFISKEANVFYNARLIAFERIKFILQSNLIPIKLFGSCANGIAIKNSDIDIAIDNSILNYFPYCQNQHKISFALQWLTGILSNFKCMKDIKLIKTAAIPIIKLTLDTSQSFDLDQVFYTFDITQYSTYLNRPHKASHIEIDITVQTHCQNLKCNHLGINTTKRINQWMQQIKPLKYIIIILKYFLNLEGLNCTYKDGINTYCLVVMLVAAIKHLNLQKEENIMVVLEKVLRFYIYEFDEKQSGIDLRNKKKIFYKKSQKDKEALSPEYTKADLEVLDPQNGGKNMTKKCYKFSLIRNLFQKIEKKCFSDQRKQIISGFLKDKKLSFANLQNQSLLKKQSLVQIAKAMENPFLQLVKQNTQIIKIQTYQSQSKQDEQTTARSSSCEGVQLLRTGSISI